MAKPLANKLVLVTGASSGIGWRTAQILAEDGAKVSVWMSYA
jgi:NAD(P)-dependent dehydrogenase (short-subunit alcohol dehydrogenase family)